MSLYNFPLLMILLCLLWLRQRDFLYFYVKKTFMEVGISIFTVLTSFYKIIQQSRSPFTSMTINLNKTIFLFLATITRDSPYGKHMDLVNMQYCQAGRTCLQIVVGWPWLDARCPPKPLYHSPPQLDRGRKHNGRLVARYKDREITQQLPSQAKQTGLGEKKLI